MGINAKIHDINILISDFEVSNIKAIIVWKKSSQEYGLCFIKSTQNWDEFIAYLDARLIKEDSEEKHLKLVA